MRLSPGSGDILSIKTPINGVFLFDVDTDAIEVISMQVIEGDFTKIGGNMAINVFGGASVDLLYEVIIRGRNVGAGRSFGLGLSYTTRRP